MIKYQFAKNELNALIDIQEISRDTLIPNTKFYCLGCGNELIPVLGEKRVKHFRHKNIEINCSSETYLHHISKLLFFNTYKHCLEEKRPFSIQIEMENYCNYSRSEFFSDCKLNKENQTFDLTRFFTSVQLEVAIDQFIPDILLKSNNGNFIFVEIAVTHKCEKEKIESGYRIIEINIHSEDDIADIRNCFLKESEQIIFYNFKRKYERDLCKGSCKQIQSLEPLIVRYQVFIVYRSGVCILWERELDHLSILHKSKMVLYFKLVAFDFTKDADLEYTQNIYIQELIKAWNRDLPIKSCFLCKFRMDNHIKILNPNSTGSIFCKKLMISGDDQLAKECKYFQVNQDILI